MLAHIVNAVCNAFRRLRPRPVAPELLLGLALALVTGAAGLASAQVCPAPEPSWPPEPLGNQWQIISQYSGGNNGCIGIVVDMTLYNDELMPPALADYVTAVAADGYSYRLVTFAGPATELRGNIQDLCTQVPLEGAGVLEGTVLIGGRIPWINAGGSPCDAYFMDIDDDDDWQYDEQTGFYNWLGDHQLEIWVSRIKADKLPDILAPGGGAASEAYIVQQYLKRNGELRWNAFDPAQSVLVYFSADPPFRCFDAEAASSAMSQAFGTVEMLCEDSQVSKVDYLQRLGDDTYTVINEGSHGSQIDHTFHLHDLPPGVDEQIRSEDYVDSHPQPVGIVLDSCFCADFSWNPAPSGELAHGYLGGSACFGVPWNVSNTLVVCGYLDWGGQRLTMNCGAELAPPDLSETVTKRR
jgi:hypothetical protein